MRDPNPALTKPPFIDKRPEDAHKLRQPRHRTLLSGKLVHGDGAFSLDCAIRDLSEGGAKVIFAKCQPIPSELYLIVVKHGVAHRARTVWLNFPARGLQFLKSYPLNATLPAELAFLRRLWADLSSRSGEQLVVGHWSEAEAASRSGGT